MDTDIRKPDTGAVQISRPASANVSTETSATPDLLSPSSETQQFGEYTEPLSEGEEDEDLDQTVAEDEEGRAGLTKGQAMAAIKYRNEMLEQTRAKEKMRAVDSAVDDDDDDDPRRPFLKSRKASVGASSSRPPNLSINPLAPATAFDKTLQQRLKKESRRQVSLVEEDDEEDGPEGQNGEHAEDASSSHGFWRFLRPLRE